MNRAIKIRIYPSKAQEELFLKTFGCRRFVYNQALSKANEAYRNSKESFSYVTAAKGLVEIKQKFPFLKEVDSVALQQSLRHLQTAFKNFFEKNASKPKFKSKKAKQSFTTMMNGNSIKLLGNKVKIPKSGWIKAVIHRQPGKDWKLNSATVSKDVDGKWYISLVFEFEKEVIKIPVPAKSIGLDYKSDGLFMDSDGNIASNYKFFRQNQKKLAKAQRKLARKIGYKKSENKSKNFLRQLLRVNKTHCHIKNCRKDFLHKLSTEIANQYDVVSVESLDMKAISNKGFHNGKSTMDNGYGLFLSMLEYKLGEQGKYFVKIDKWFPSSQICCKCGKRKKLSLADRTYTCECGNNIDRDWNAAINIDNEGLRMLKDVA